MDSVTEKPIIEVLNFLSYMSDKRQAEDIEREAKKQQTINK
jgi:hypothetical protein